MGMCGYKDRIGGKGRQAERRLAKVIQARQDIKEGKGVGLVPGWMKSLLRFMKS